jgi:formate C-acetyltransferase
MEQMHGGIIGNGRMDQYLWPYYTADTAAGRLFDERRWSCWTACGAISRSSSACSSTPRACKLYEGHDHWEHTTIGGLLPQGGDATNALTHLLLRSWREFPLDYPDLGVRIHERRRRRCWKSCAPCMRRASPCPSCLMMQKSSPGWFCIGAEQAEALDYCGSAAPKPAALTATPT